MPEDVRANMEGAFGKDFSRVRLFEGSEADSLGALAYTRGTDIHFAPGQYAPHSQRGQELLGHELAHVVQQAEGRVQATTQAKGMGINDEPSLESEADEWGAKAARWEQRGATTTQRDGGQSEDSHLVQMKCERCQDESEPERAKKASSLGRGTDEGCESCEDSGPEARRAKAVLEQNAVQFEKSPVQAKSRVVQLHTKEDCDQWYEECNEGCRRLPNKTRLDKARRALCWSGCMAEYATCLASTEGAALTFAALVAAIVLASADGPFPVGDAAAAALLMSVGLMPE